MIREMTTSDLFDHIHALARVIHPVGSMPGLSWWKEILQKYQIPVPEYDPHDLTVDNLYTLWSGLLGAEADRFMEDKTLQQARGEHESTFMGSGRN